MAEAGLFKRRRPAAARLLDPRAPQLRRCARRGLIAELRPRSAGAWPRPILLPNNRAVRTVTEAFVRASGGGLLLPRLIAIGDPELDERIGGALDPLDRRRDSARDRSARAPLLLARLVRREGESAAEAMRLAARTGADDGRAGGRGNSASRLVEAVAGYARTCRALAAVARAFRAVLDRWPRDACRARRDRPRRAAQPACSTRIADAGRERPPDGFHRRRRHHHLGAGVAALLARRGAAAERARWSCPALARLQVDAAPRNGTRLGPDDGRARRGNPSAISSEAAARPDGRRARRGQAVARRAGARHRLRRAAGRSPMPWRGRFTDKWTELVAARAPADRHSRRRTARPGERGAGDRHCLREALETPGRPRPWSRPTATWPRGSRRICALGDRGRRQRRPAAVARPRPAPCSWRSPRRRPRSFAPVPLLALLKHPLVGGEGEERLAWLERCARSTWPCAGRGRAPASTASTSDFADKKAEHGLGARSARWSCARWSALLAGAGDSRRSCRDVARMADALAGDRAWRGADGRAAAELLAAIEASRRCGSDMRSRRDDTCRCCAA